MVWMTPDEEEAFEERAGILQFDAGLSRGRSEQVARAMVMAKRDSQHPSDRVISRVLDIYGGVSNGL